RLRQINGARILRGPSGELLHLVPQAPGWPGLHFGFDGQGRRKTWGADATGTAETLFDAQGRAVRRRFSDGGEWHYLYDAQGRPRRITARNHAAFHVTRLAWDQNRLTRISHPHENESRRYDMHGRLTEKRLQRPFAVTPPGQAEYVDRFEYDARHHPIIHHLPEGGALLYGWAASGRLLRIDWLDADGRLHNVIRAA